MSRKVGEIALHLQSHRVIFLFINVAWAAYQYCLRITFLFFRVCPIQKKKIVISNINGRGYSDHPKYIVEELNKSMHSYDLVWVLSCNDRVTAELPENIRTAPFGSLKATYELSTAKIWIDNAEKRLSVIKRKRQCFLDTWHGFGPKSAVDNDSISGWRISTHLKHNAKMIDAYVSNNNLLTHIYHTDFFYSGDVLEVGFPRNDILINGDNNIVIKKVFGRYSLALGTHIVLYAPTYRPHTDLSLYNLNYAEILSFLTEKFGGKWIFFLRLHPVISRLSSDVIALNPGIIDVSNYLDMQELLAVTEVLITDYSSCMFDFAVTRKPCILYHPDEKEYENSRGFCIPPEELPFPRAHTNEGLQHIIETFDELEYRKTLEAYLKKIGFMEDGNASKAVVEWIEKKIEEDS